MIPVPIYDENHHILRTVEFEDNLTIDAPPYRASERGCGIGLVRLNNGRYEGMLVLITYDYFHPSSSHAEFISEEKAYEMCLNRGRAKLIEDLHINPLYNEGEIEVL